RRRSRHGPVEFAPLFAKAVAVAICESKPRFRNIAHSLQSRLHFRLLLFHRVAIGVGGNPNRRREKHHRVCERIWKLKKIPRLLKCMRTFQSNMEYGYRPSSSARQNHRTRLRHVARAARTVNGDSDVASCLEASCHRGQAFNRAARRTSLRGPESEPLDYTPSPLAVKVDSVEHHDTSISPKPCRGKNTAMPKRTNPRFASIANLHGVVHSNNLKAQRWTQQADHPVRCPREHGNLHPSPERKPRHGNAHVRARVVALW